MCTGSKRHGQLCRFSTKSTVLNSTLSPVSVYRALLVLVQVSVAELTGAGVNVLTVSATDSDSADNGRVTYSMLPLDSFNISATTGNTHLYARQSTTGSTHLYMLQSPIQVTLTCTHDSLLQVTLTCTGCSHRYR